MFFRLAEIGPGETGPGETGPGETGPGETGPGETGWQPAGLLYAVGASPLDAMLDDAVTRLGGCERRVAASLLFQGYAARLLSPQVGCLVTKGCVPAVPAAALRWRRPDAEVVELGLVAGGGWRGASDALTGLVLTQSFD